MRTASISTPKPESEDGKALPAYAPRFSLLLSMPRKHRESFHSARLAQRLVMLLVVTALISGTALYLTTRPTPADRTAPGQATILSVIDGDTVEVRLQKRIERVRLLGIDTPESVDPHRPVGCFGKEASAFTTSLLPKGTDVRLEVDTQTRDRYGRLLAYLYRESDGLFVNNAIASNGYATTLSIAPNTTHADMLRSSVLASKSSGLGLWAHCPPLPLK